MLIILFGLIVLAVGLLSTMQEVSKINDRLDLQNQLNQGQADFNKLQTSFNYNLLTKLQP